MNSGGIIYPDKVLSLATDFVASSLGYSFSPNEKSVIELFFSNIRDRVFFMHSLPANVGASLMSMFSRMKNPRGLRGIFVDSFLPQLLATQLREVETEFGGNEGEFTKERKIINLDAFISHSTETKSMFEELLANMGTDLDYLAKFSESRKTGRFLNTWLDKFGHNSIARMASLWICFEGISLLAAKTIEWSRPGAGYIELSTRYVNMSGRDCYPVEKELEAGWGINPSDILKSREQCFNFYHQLAGSDFDGPFPDFLRKNYGHLYQDAPKDLEAGITGETCDVLGNLLPASTLTSVGACISGESFPMLVKHLFLDDTPESLALASRVQLESSKTGANQFLHHFEPTEWDRAHWQYLGLMQWVWYYSGGKIRMIGTDLERLISEVILPVMNIRYDSWPIEICRDAHDKLPAEFEFVTVPFSGAMSFRGWRDLHRQGFCTHFRTYLTTLIGYYRYDKPAPIGLPLAFASQSGIDWNLEKELNLRSVPNSIKQYPLTLGNKVGFMISANLREWEFCNWQRTKYSVNHEVRQVFLDIEKELRKAWPGWARLSRANMTPAYVFARGSKAIPLY